MAVERISLKAFDDAINEFRNSITKYEEARERIFSQTDKLLIEWEGEGKKKYENAYVLLKTQLKDEEDSLRTIAENLEDIALSFREWDSSVSKQVKG